MKRVLALFIFAAAALAACEQGPGETLPPPEHPDRPADMGMDMVGPEAVPAPEVVAVPIAPSTDEPCPDEGPRLPISGACKGRAVNFVIDPTELMMDAPDGCHWEMTEVPFVMDAMLFRALNCEGTVTALDYAGGAHAAELSYLRSAYGREAAEGTIAVRVATWWDSEDWRLLETIPEESRDACEILPAGPGYPASAKVIAAKPGAEGADCGRFVRGGETDNFWIVREEYVYAFTLPEGPRDLDPASFVVVTPH